MKKEFLSIITVAGLIASSITGCTSKSSSDQDDAIPAEVTQSAQMQSSEDGQAGVGIIVASEIMGALFVDSELEDIVGDPSNTPATMLSQLPSISIQKGIDTQLVESTEGNYTVQCTYDGNYTVEWTTLPDVTDYYAETYTFNHCVMNTPYIDGLPSSIFINNMIPGDMPDMRYTFTGIYRTKFENNSTINSYSQEREAEALALVTEDNATGTKISEAYADGMVKMQTRTFNIPDADPAPETVEKVYTADMEQSFKGYENDAVVYEQINRAIGVDLNATTTEQNRIFTANGYSGSEVNGDLVAYLFFDNYVSTWNWPAMQPTGTEPFTADITINGTVGASCIGGKIDVETVQTIVLDTNVSNTCGEAVETAAPGFELLTTIPKAGEVHITGDGSAVVTFDYNTSTNIASATIAVDGNQTTYTCAEDMVGNSTCGDIVGMDY